MPKHGVFITLEGTDGTGKSTQARLLASWLRRSGYSVCVTREPGGTKTGEQIRRWLLGASGRAVSPLSELLLMYAARAQHLEEIVRPSLERGDVVLSDRYNDSSFAYQGHGRRLGSGPVRTIDSLVCGRMQPDLTILLDGSARTGLERAARRGRGRPLRRFEEDGARFQERVRQGYKTLARNNPGRIKTVRSGQTVAEVQAEIRKIVSAFLRARPVRPSRARLRAAKSK